jgi:hypothetical protein
LCCADLPNFYWNYTLLCTVSAQQQCQILLEFADDLQLGLEQHFTGVKNILK